MKIDRKGLKAQAKQAIRAAAPVFWLVTLVYLLLTEGLSTVVGWLAPTFQPADLLWGGTVGWLSLFISILLTLYLWVMDFGYRLWALRVTRSQQAGYGTLLEGFGIAGRVIAMNLLILLFTFLWSLLLIFVTTILAFFVLDSLFLQLLVMAGIYAAVFAIMLRYAMAPYLLADYPDDGAGAAVRRSVEMMRGRKWELFKLYVSFLGWELLGVLLTLLAYLPFLTGILAQVNSVAQFYSVLSSLIPAAGLALLINLPLTLWLTPYRTAAEALFYRSILEGRAGRPGRRRRRADVRRNVGTAQPINGYESGAWPGDRLLFRRNRRHGSSFFEQNVNFPGIYWTFSRDTSMILSLCTRPRAPIPSAPRGPRPCAGR